MKTSNKHGTAEERNRKRFSTGQLPFKQPAQPENSKLKNTRKWLKIIEFATVSFATWLNPEAGLLIFLLKLCFQILELVQEEQER